jgi:hypothetical protein
MSNIIFYKVKYFLHSESVSFSILGRFPSWAMEVVLATLLQFTLTASGRKPADCPEALPARLPECREDTFHLPFAGWTVGGA